MSRFRTLFACSLLAAGPALADDLEARRYTGLTLSYQFGGHAADRPLGLSFGPLGVSREVDLQPALLQLPLINVPLAGAGRPSLAPVDLVSDVVRMLEGRETERRDPAP